MAGAQSPAHHPVLLWHKLLNLPHNVQQELRSEEREGSGTSLGTLQDAPGLAEEHAVGFAASQIIYPSLSYCPAVGRGQTLTSLQGWVMAVKAEGGRRGNRWIPIVASLPDAARLLQGFPHS